MTILYFYHVFIMYLLLTLAYWWISWHIPPLIPFSAINTRSMSVNRSYISDISIRILWKLLNTSASNNASLWTYKSCHLNFLFENLYKLFLCTYNLHQYYLPCLASCKNLLSLEMMPHWNFSNYQCIHICKRLFATIQ